MRSPRAVGLLAAVVVASLPVLNPAPAAAAPPAGNLFPVASANASCNSAWQVPAGHVGVDCVSVGNELGAALVAVESGTIGEVLLPNGTYDCTVDPDGPGKGGNALFLIGQSGHSYYYGHLDLVMVDPGQSVQRGDVIATLGRTGNAGCGTSVPHLHFEIKPVGGDPFNPQPHVNNWARPPAQPLIRPTVTGNISGLTNPVVIPPAPYTRGAVVGCVSGGTYTGLLTLRYSINDIVQPTTVHVGQACGGYAIGFPLPARKVCVDVYGSGAWRPLGCRGIATGSMGATATTMTGENGNGTIAGRAAIEGFGGLITVRTLVGTTTGPSRLSNPDGTFSAAFAGAAPGSRICGQANSYGMWVTLGCRGTAEGSLSSLNWAANTGRATGVVNIPDFNNGVLVRLFVDGRYANWAYSAAGAGNRSYSIPFTAPPGATVCVKADSWGHQRSLGCRST